MDAVESLENEEYMEVRAFSDGLCCVCSGLALVSWDAVGVVVGRAGAGGGFLRGCAVVGAGVGRMGAGGCDSSGILVRGCVIGGVGVGRVGAAGGGRRGCARSGREVGFVVGSLAGARTEDDGSDRSITGGRC